MSDDAGTTLSGDEKLARFVLKKEWIRKVDNSIKQDAFVPPKDLQLSVTRHAGISEKKLIEIGKSVAVATSLELFGRADIEARILAKRALKAVAWPLPNNENHAHIVEWPPDKEARKTIAQELAAAAKYVPV